MRRPAPVPRNLSGSCSVSGSESPPDLYLTAALAAALPDARTRVLAGQAHEGMKTAPDQYAESVIEFLLG